MHVLTRVPAPVEDRITKTPMQDRPAGLDVSNFIRINLAERWLRPGAKVPPLSVSDGSARPLTQVNTGRVTWVTICFKADRATKQPTAAPEMACCSAVAV